MPQAFSQKKKGYRQTDQQTESHAGLRENIPSIEEMWRTAKIVNYQYFSSWTEDGRHVSRGFISSRQVNLLNNVNDCPANRNYFSKIFQQKVSTREEGTERVLHFAGLY